MIMASPFDLLGGLNKLMTPEAMKAMQELPEMLGHWARFMDALVRHNQSIENRLVLIDQRLANVEHGVQLGFDNAARDQLQGVIRRLDTIHATLCQMRGDVDPEVLAAFALTIEREKAMQAEDRERGEAIDEFLLSKEEGDHDR
jgi:hypothetical protein